MPTRSPPRATAAAPRRRRLAARSAAAASARGRRRALCCPARRRRQSRTRHARRARRPIVPSAEVLQLAQPRIERVHARLDRHQRVRRAQGTANAVSSTDRWSRRGSPPRRRTQRPHRALRQTVRRRAAASRGPGRDARRRQTPARARYKYGSGRWNTTATRWASAGVARTSATSSSSRSRLTNQRVGRVGGRVWRGHEDRQRSGAFPALFLDPRQNIVHALVESCRQHVLGRHDVDHRQARGAWPESRSPPSTSPAGRPAGPRR